MRKNKSLGTVITLIVVCSAILILMLVAFVSRITNSIDFSRYTKPVDNNAALIETVIPGNADNGNIGDHVKGSADAPVKIFEYADFQCSGCASANPRVNMIVEEFDGKVAVIYRNFLLSYHQNGTAAASAAEAAGLQGYWKEYTDMLFANQSVWADASGDNRTNLFVDLFETISKGKGDVAKFKSDMSSAAVKKKIAFDMGLGQSLNLPGTPSFYLDGERIDFSTITGEEDFLNIFRDKINTKLAELEKQ